MAIAWSALPMHSIDAVVFSFRWRVAVAIFVCDSAYARMGSVACRFVCFSVGGPGYQRKGASCKIWQRVKEDSRW